MKRKQKKRETFQAPNGEKRILLHSCCAPCSGPVIEKMHAAGLELTIFFYNPNIHPKREYEIRKEENIRYAQKLGIPFYDADYDRDNWFEKIKGLEWEPERGERCSKCFDMRFLRTAAFAKERGFAVFTSSLGISRWKDMDQINRCGRNVAAAFDGITYWEYNWRKQGGSSRMIELAKEEAFYQQQYCGCVFSLRDTNRHRIKSGRKPIRIGEDFYTK